MLIIDLLIAAIAPKFIPYLGFFAYQKDLLKFNLPKFIYSFANFDGIYYLRIANNGYQQYEQAFFPFYPFLIRFLSPIFLNNKLLTALFISNFSFVVGLIFFLKFLKLVTKNFQKKYLIFLIFFFPTSFFFNAAYTESLFFLLVTSVLYFSKKKKFHLTFFLSFLSALTRFVGVFLFIPLLLEVINFKKKKFLGIIFAPLLGLSTYMFYLLKTTGDPFYFFNSQSVFGEARSTKFIFLPQVYFRYLKIFLTASFNFQYFISFFEFLIFNFVFIILILDLIKILKKGEKNFSLLGLNLFSLINILLPTLTGSFMSIPRFTLLSLSFFLYLSSVKNFFLIKILLFLFFILHVVLFGFFIQGYFIS